MTPSFFRHFLCVIAWLSLVIFASTHGAWATTPPPKEDPSATEAPAGRRFSATRPFTPVFPEEDALIVAETAARLDALQALVRDLVSLPEVRIAGSVSPATPQAANLLALAHATANTSVLLRGKSRKSATVTVTVVLEEDGSGPPIAARVRDALLHPDRLSLHGKTVLREKTILKTIDAALARATPNASARNRMPEEFLQELLNELKALTLFTRQLPLRNRLWEDPTAVRNAMRAALALSPNSALCRNAVGDAALQLGSSQEAWEEQTLAIRAEPDFARAFHSRGAASLALGHLSSAVADFSEAIRLSPQAPSHYRARGMARHLLGEISPMCDDLLRACTLGECEEFQWAIAENFCNK